MADYWILNGIEVHSGKCFVSKDRFEIVGPGGRTQGKFLFPMIGRPNIAVGTNAAASVFEAGAITFSGELDATSVITSLRDALHTRMFLRATGNNSKTSPLSLGDPISDPGLGDGMHWIDASGAVEDRVLYDVCIARDDGPTEVVAPHAVYFRSNWSDLGIVHITDIHVARRIDTFQDTLINLGRQAGADQMYNWNDRFRGFIKYANSLHSQGLIDVILATGDIYDYIHEKHEDESDGGNALFMRELLLGLIPGRPPVDQVEELRVPIFMTPGNHDYRKRAYELKFNLEVLDIDVKSLTFYENYNLSASDALAITRGDNGTDVPSLTTGEAAPAVDVEEEMSKYREHLSRETSYIVNLGPHKIAMLDSAQDVGVVKTKSEFVSYKLNSSEDERNFMDGSPNSKGVESGELAMVADALANTPENGLFIIGLHAPILNTKTYPYYFRESLRPSLPNSAYGFFGDSVAPIGGPDKAIREKHDTWFGLSGEESVAFEKRRDAADQMDYGTSRGKVMELLAVASGKNGGRRADLMLHGHIHIWNEMRISVENGELNFFTDFYTMNPARYYNSPVFKEWQVTGLQGVHARSESVQVFVSDRAPVVSSPMAVGGDENRKKVVFIPPNPDTLNSSGNPAEWWERHRPLVLQTEAYGPLKDAHVNLGGFRMIEVKGNVIQKIHTINTNRLNASGYTLPFDQAIQPEPLTPQRHFQRSIEHGSPKAKGMPFGYPYAGGGQNIIYRDEHDRMIELWRDGSDNRGNGNLTDTPAGDHHPKAAGNPFIYYDTVQSLQVLPYRGQDGHIHSLYWSTGTAMHDALSATANAPKSAGDPIGCFNPATNEHVVVYRSVDGHLRTLYWTGQGSVGTEDPTKILNGTKPAGDPWLYLNPNRGMFIAPYRGSDNRIRSLYWTQASPYGEDNLSGTAQTPNAEGDPMGYYLADTDTHQVFYRGEDGHIYELWWVGDAPVSGWNLTASAGAPTAKGDPFGLYVSQTNTKHVVYRGANDRVYDLSWTPGGGNPSLTDLCEYAMAPAAKGDVHAYVDETGGCHALYLGPDDHVQEIRFGAKRHLIDPGLLHDIGRMDILISR